MKLTKKDIRLLIRILPLIEVEKLLLVEDSINIVPLIDRLLEEQCKILKEVIK